MRERERKRGKNPLALCRLSDLEAKTECAKTGAINMERGGKRVGGCVCTRSHWSKRAITRHQKNGARLNMVSSYLFG